MRKGMWRASLLTLLVGALALQGCEQTGPTGIPSPTQISEARQHGKDHPLHKVGRRGGAEAKAGVAVAVIGKKGGEVVLGDHRLTVPEGAVSHPTRFSMRLVEDGHVEVDLSATTLGRKSRENDVGERGFAKPVTLRLSYAEADAAADPSRLVIVWVRPDGALEPQASAHDAQGRAIRAPLRHFSPYALASD